MSWAVVLVNVGSPASPSVRDVRRYLAEFLMDPLVLDTPWLIRAAVVYGAILPNRPKESSMAYQSVWTEAGSPLVATTAELVALLSEKVSVPVKMAMRYGQPSIPSVLKALQTEIPDLSDIYLIPLYPHYALSSTQTAVDCVQEVVAKFRPKVRVSVHPSFYKDFGYIETLSALVSPYLEDEYDHILHSYHGLPERHLRKADPTGTHCLASLGCCESGHVAHETCYRAQVYQTSRLVMAQLGVPNSRYSVSFQSRLGRDPWLKPYTDAVIVDLAQKGVRRLKVMCPAFVTDCLETIEEIGDRARHDFLSAGGTSFELIPCLNTHPQWIETLAGWIERATHDH